MSILHTGGKLCKMKSGCIDDMVGSTGSTFYACFLFLCRLKPRSFVFESVPGLVFSGEIEAVRAKCSEAGYYFIWWWGNPMKVGGPHDRDRVPHVQLVL